MKDQKLFDEKLKNLSKEKEKAAQEGDNAALGNILYQLGDLHSEHDRLDEARGHYESALAHFEKGGSNEDCAMTLLQICGALGDRGDVDQGIEKGKAALALLKDSENYPLLDTGFAQLAKLHKIKKDFAAALEFFQEGKKVAEKLKNRSRTTVYALETGSVLLELDRVDEAIVSLGESERIAREIEDLLAQAQASVLLAEAKLRKKDFEGVEDLLARACEIFQLLDRPRELFDGARRLTLFALEREERDNAQEYAKEAFVSVVASGDLALQAEGLDLLEQVALPVRHYAAFFAVFLTRSASKDDELFKKYFAKLLDTLRSYFADFRFTEVIDFSDVVLTNIRKAKKLRTFPESFSAVERAMEITGYIGKSRGDRSSSNWRSADRLAEEMGDQEFLGLNMKKRLMDFTI